MKKNMKTPMYVPQLLNYVDDQDLNKKPDVWEKFYNFSRPHGAFGGRAPYEILRERLK
jgi:hypothetical protein